MGDRNWFLNRNLWIWTLCKERDNLNDASIYEPIRQEMVQVEEKLNQVVRDAPPQMSEQLAHVLNGGKLIRPALTLLAGKFYQGNLNSLITVAAAVELLHTATLMHDDVIDNSHFRRGKPTINSLWGNFQAVLLGDYVFAASAHMTAETENIRAMKLHAQTLMIICRGEIEESLSPFDQNREHYFQRIGDKTASLFSAATEFGAILSEAPEGAVQSLKEYGYNLGMSFQIVDDILDFVGQMETMGKPVASDLSQGVLTLPTILFLERPQSKAIKEIFERDRESGIKLIMDKVYEPGVLEECYHIAQGYCSRACLALEQLPHNPISSLLSSLTDQIIKRAK